MGHSIKNGRAKINETDGSLFIEIPVLFTFANVLPGIVFSVIWAIGMVGMVALLLAPERPVSADKIDISSILLPMTILWSFFGIWILRELFWCFFGKEKISFSEKEMTIGKNSPLSQSHRSYLLKKISNLRVSKLLIEFKAAPSNIIPTGNIAFDYGASTIRFGDELEEEEALIIVERINERFFSESQKKAHDSAIDINAPIYLQELHSFSLGNVFQIHLLTDSLVAANVGKGHWANTLTDGDRPENQADSELLNRYEKLAPDTKEFLQADPMNFVLAADELKMTSINSSRSWLSGALPSSGTLTFLFKDGQKRSFVIIGRQDLQLISKKFEDARFTLNPSLKIPTMECKELPSSLELTIPHALESAEQSVVLVMVMMALILFFIAMQPVRSDKDLIARAAFIGLGLICLAIAFFSHISSAGKEKITINKESFVIARKLWGVGPSVVFPVAEMRNLRLLDDALQFPGLKPIQGLSSIILNCKGSFLAFDYGDTTIRFCAAQSRREAEKAYELINRYIKVPHADMSTIREKAEENRSRRTFGIVLAIISFVCCTYLYISHNQQNRLAMRKIAKLPRNKRSRF